MSRSKTQHDSINKASTVLSESFLAIPFKNHEKIRSLNGGQVFSEHPEKVLEYIGALRQRGVKSPERMLAMYPHILGRPLADFDRCIQFFRDNGIVDPVNTFMQSAYLVTFSQELLTRRVAELKQLGFTDIPRLLRKSADILSHKKESVERRLHALAACGIIDPIAFMQDNPLIVIYSPERIVVSFSLFKKMGISDPLFLIERFPMCFGVSQEGINKVQQTFAERGYSNVLKYIEYNPCVVLMSDEALARELDAIPENVMEYLVRRKETESVPLVAFRKKVAHLTALGFACPVQFVFNSKRGLSGSTEDIDRIIEGLTRRGCTRSRQILTAYPWITDFDDKKIDTLCNDLRGIGYSDPMHLINTAPFVLRHDISYLKTRLDEIRQRGFSDPNTMTIFCRELIDRPLDRLDEKIALLKKIGVVDPVRCIERNAKIIIYTDCFLAKQLEFIHRIIHIYYPNTQQAQQFMQALIEKIPTILGTKMEKILIIIRVLQKYSVPIEAITMSGIKTLLGRNIESLVLAERLTQAGTSFEGYRKKLYEVETLYPRKESVPEKRELILADTPSVDKNDKLFRTYVKGYGAK